MNCPECQSPNTTVQVVTESRKTGCGTLLFYLILTISIFGIFILIPLLLRKKTETVTYRVCQTCGHRALLSRA